MIAIVSQVIASVLGLVAGLILRCRTFPLLTQLMFWVVVLVFVLFPPVVIILGKFNHVVFENGIAMLALTGTSFRIIASLLTRKEKGSQVDG